MALRLAKVSSVATIISLIAFSNFFYLSRRSSFWWKNFT